MNKILLLSAFIFSGAVAFAQLPPEENPHRGLYVDRFVKTIWTSSSIIDPNFSILSVDTNRDGIFEREDALLQFCSEYHFTTITLYDLHRIFSKHDMAWNENTHMNEDLEKHLCRFIEKAKTQYCIDEISAAGGSTTIFDSLDSYLDRYPLTEPYRLRAEQKHSVKFDTTLNMVERVYPAHDARAHAAELLKFALRMADFSECNDCQADFDYLNIEDEFWYDCTNELPNFEAMMFAMNSVKQMHNLAHPDNPFKTEVYLAFLNSCTTPADTVVRILDGCNNCSPCNGCNNPHEKQFDRMLYSQLTGNPFYWDFAVQNIFENTATADSTDYHPLLYAEGIEQGATIDYLGTWIAQSPYNTFYHAEQLYYAYWRTASGAQLGLPRMNDVQPGGVQWFTSSYMTEQITHPPVIHNEGPLCSSVPVAIANYYVGPPEWGINFQFWISRNSDGQVVYPYSGDSIVGVTHSYFPGGGGFPESRAVDFNDTAVFPPTILPPGDYTQHIAMQYEHGNGCAHVETLPMIIADRPRAQFVGDSVFCEGHHTFLRATAYAGSYQWYRNNMAIPGATDIFYKAIVDGDYYCALTSSGSMTCAGNTDTLHVRVKPSPPVRLNAWCNTNGTITLKTDLDTANAMSTNIYGQGGLLYRWNTGAVTDQITVSPASSNTFYRVNVTDPYSGCMKYREIVVPIVPNTTYSAYTTVPVTPSGPCANDGEVAVYLSPSPTGNPVSYLWSNGATTPIAYNLAPGFYSVVMSVWNNACSIYASVLLGPAPTNAPVVNATVANAHCNGDSNGAINLNLSGGNAPFTFAWSGIPNDGFYNPYSDNQQNLFPGTYHLNITDSLGCEFPFDYFVGADNAAINIAVSNVVSVTQCAGNATGSATVAASGGQAPYSYEWNDSLLQTTASASNLHAGTYHVVATDANGCTETKLVSIPTTIADLTVHLLDSSVTAVACAISSDANLFACVHGGNNPYTVSSPWVLDTDFVSLVNIGAGNYAVSITDSNGCVTTENFLVTAPAGISIATAVTNTGCVGCPNGSILLNTSGGTPPYVYTWSPAVGVMNGNNIDSLPAGTYNICATDINGCVECVDDTVLDDPLSGNGFEVSGLGFEVFPNPAADKIVVSGQWSMVNRPSSMVIAIYNSLGAKVFSSEEKNVAAIFSKEIPLEDFAVGIYLLKVQSNSASISKKFLVEK